MYSLGDHIRSSDAVRFWVMLGNLIGLSEEHESFAYPYFMRRVQDVFPRGQTKRCHWYACICAEDRHPPHSKRICTGCAQAYYCSFQCQRSDWEEGPHRETFNIST
ncbi:hypothetical protein K474DRAFT_1498627 [Panus rudis PR-1116 ss-1]|nr:hypothetical protein K474DRAFT_1498627 [Panus rudis PR-1116 ss-1]